MTGRIWLLFLIWLSFGQALSQSGTSGNGAVDQEANTALYLLQQGLLLADEVEQLGLVDSANSHRRQVLYLLDSVPWGEDVQQTLLTESEGLLDAGNVATSVLFYQLLLKHPALPDTLRRQVVKQLGWAHIIAADFEQALPYFQDLLSTSADVKSDIYALREAQAYCYLNLGLIDSASYFVAQLLAEDTQTVSSLAHDCRAVLHMFAGDTTAAVLSSERAVATRLEAMDDRLATGYYNHFAEGLLGLGLKEEALLMSDSALAFLIPSTPRAEVVAVHKTRSVILESMGRYEEALESLNAHLVASDSLLGRAAGAGDYSRLTAENGRLARRVAAAQEDMKDQHNWIIVLVVTLFLSLFFSIRYLRTLQKSKWAYTKLQESNRKVVTQSKEIALAQEEIIKSEKMAFLGRVFAGVGHELNTPIAAVKANLQLIEDAQMQEIRKMKELATVFTPHILDIMTELIIASYQAQQNPLSTLKQRALKKTLRTYFKEELAGDPMDFADMFDDLKVYDGLKRFEPIYRHDNGVDILELVMFIAHRTRSIFTAMEALQRADKILFSLKSYSFKNLQDEKVKFDLIRNINNIITLHQNKLKNVTVYKQFEESVEIEGYPDELTQVWTNLISNATYANKYRGNLWIRVKQFDDKVRVDIEDSGGGIDPKVKERIFEPFETTKPEGEGTGLGLSITKRVIDKHKGSIAVENSATGALFSVTLPKNLS